jgi:hypothetical protein
MGRVTEGAGGSGALGAPPSYMQADRARVIRARMIGLMFVVLSFSA